MCLSPFLYAQPPLKQFCLALELELKKQQILTFPPDVVELDSGPEAVKKSASHFTVHLR